MAGLSVRNLTRRKAPVFPFMKAAQRLKGWDLSLVFVTDARAKSLNQALRKKDYVPNVLSYETGKKSGEVIICLSEAARQAPTYDLPYADFCGFLFIHGLLHLEGYRHGPTMDKHERTLLKRFVPVSLNETKNRNRNRHRHLAGEGRRR